MVEGRGLLMLSVKLIELLVLLLVSVFMVKEYVELVVIVM